MSDRGKYQRGKYPDRSDEEYENGYIAWLQKQSVRGVARAIGRSEKLAKSYINEGWAGRPSYRARQIAEQEELRRAEEASGRKSTAEQMQEAGDLVVRALRITSYAQLLKATAIVEKVKAGQLDASELESIKLPSADDLLKFMKIYEFTQRLVGATGQPEEMRHDTALLNVTEVMSAMSKNPRGSMVGLFKKRIDQIEERDNGKEAE